jgi:hypothetical protein
VVGLDSVDFVVVDGTKSKRARYATNAMLAIAYNFKRGPQVSGAGGGGTPTGGK